MMELKKLFEAITKKKEDGKPEKGMDKTGWILLVLLGLLFLVIAMPTDGGKKTEDKTANVQEDWETGTSRQSMTDKDQLEERLELALSNIEGVGKVRVMITYKDNGTQVVEKDGNSSSSSTTEEDSSGGTRKVTESERNETTVYNSTGGDGEPFIAKELTPAIEGILVVAEGGNKTSVKQNISNAVLALFPVEAHKIVVVKMND